MSDELKRVWSVFLAVNANGGADHRVAGAICPLLYCICHPCRDVTSSIGMSSRVTNNCWAKTFVSRVHLPRLQVKFTLFQKQEPKKLRLRRELSPQTLNIKRVSVVFEAGRRRIPIGVQQISLLETLTSHRPIRMERPIGNILIADIVSNGNHFIAESGMK